MLCPEKVKVSNLIFPWSQYIAFIVLDKLLWNILSYTFFLSAFIAFQLVRELKQTAATTVVRTLANIVFPFRIESCRGIFSMSLFAIGIPNMSIQFRFSLVKCYFFFFFDQAVWWTTKAISHCAKNRLENNWSGKRIFSAGRGTSAYGALSSNDFLDSQHKNSVSIN